MTNEPTAKISDDDAAAVPEYKEWLDELEESTRGSCRLCHGTGVYEPDGGAESQACPRHCVSARTALLDIGAASSEGDK